MVNCSGEIIIFLQRKTRGPVKRLSCTMSTMACMDPSTAYSTTTHTACQRCIRWIQRKQQDGAFPPESGDISTSPHSPLEKKARGGQVSQQHLGADVRWPWPHRWAVQPAWPAGWRLAGLWEHGGLHRSSLLYLQWLPKTGFALRHVPPSLVRMPDSCTGVAQWRPLEVDV